jgi:hypothetical protein
VEEVALVPDQCAVQDLSRLQVWIHRCTPQFVHREVVEQTGEDCAVGVCESALADLTSKDE